jgi:hypothetical protein
VIPLNVAETPAIESGKGTVEAIAVEAASPVPKSETKDPGLRGSSGANEAAFTAPVMHGGRFPV